MVAVPAGLIAERRVIGRLMRANAVSLESATPLDGLRRLQARRLARLIDAGVIHESQPGRYYLDIPMLAEREESRRHRIAFAILLAMVIVAVSSYFAAHASR